MSSYTAGMSRSWSVGVPLALSLFINFFTLLLVVFCIRWNYWVIRSNYFPDISENKSDARCYCFCRQPSLQPFYLALFCWPKWRGLWVDWRWDEVLMCSLLSCQPVSLPVYLAAAGLGWPGCMRAWLLADCPPDRGGADLALSSDLHSDLWVPLLSLVPSHPPALLTHPCGRAEFVSRCTSLSQNHKQGLPVSAAYTAVYKQTNEMQQIREFIF